MADIKKIQEDQLGEVVAQLLFDNDNGLNSDIRKITEALGEERDGEFIPRTNGSSDSVAGQFYYIKTADFSGRTVRSLSLNFTATGVFTVLEATGVNSAGYNIVKKITFQITSTGVQTITLTDPIVISASNWIGFGDYTDTAKFKCSGTNANPIGGGCVQRSSGGAWSSSQIDLCIGLSEGSTSQLGANFVRKTEVEATPSNSTNPVSSKAVFDLSAKLYGGSSGGEDITLSTFRNLNAAESTAPAGIWVYQNYSKFTGIFIKTVRLNISAAGTVSLMAITNAPNAGATRVIKTVTLAVGVQTISVNEALGQNETLGFFQASDTAKFKFGAEGSGTAGNGGFITKNNVSGAWQAAKNFDLDIEVISSGTEGDIQRLEREIRESDSSGGGLFGKSFCVLGDSISTYSGMIPAGHPSAYPNYGVTDWLSTWWGLLVKDYGMKFLTNASYSGGTVTGTATNSLSGLVHKLGSVSPDFIFFFCGTNDFGAQKPIGDFNFYSFDRNVFAQSLCYMFEQARTLYPDATLVMLSPTQRNYTSQSNGKFPSKVTDGGIFQYEYIDTTRRACSIYGVKFIDLYASKINFYNVLNFCPDGLHPNPRGMRVIADELARNI